MRSKGRRYAFVGFLLFLLCKSAFGSGFSFGMQKAWSARGGNFVYTGGYMIKSERRDWEYYEGGVVVLPGVRSGVQTNERGAYSRQYQNSAYGFYGGYYFYFSPIFRPGILRGTVVRDNVTYGSRDGRDYYLHSYSDFRMDYYIAFSIQAGIFAFIISNYGIGGGLNYMF